MLAYIWHDVWEISLYSHFSCFLSQGMLWPPSSQWWGLTQLQCEKQQILCEPHSCFQLLSFCTPQETSMALPSLQQSLVLSSQIRLIRSSLTMSLTQNPKENELRLSARWKGWTALSLKKKKMRTKMLLMAVETRVCKQINNFWFFFFGLALTFNWNSKIFIEVFIEQVIGFYFLWNLYVEQCITYGSSCKRIWVFLPVINRQ